MSRKMQVAGLAVCIGLHVADAQDRKGLLIKDGSQVRIELSYKTAKGVVEATAFRPYAGPEGEPMVGNLKAFAAVGSKRTEAEASHPDGADIRFGFYKIDEAQPLFPDILRNSDIVMKLSGVKCEEDALAWPKTTLIHVMWSDKVVEEQCLTAGKELFLTLDPSEKLPRLMTEKNSRMGVLAQKVVFERESDGSTSVTVRLPYALLKHLSDRYPGTGPGQFVEPRHFHVEFEMLRADVAKQLVTRDGLKH